MLIVNRNRIKGPTLEVDTGAGFFIENAEESKPQTSKIVHEEGRVQISVTQVRFNI